MLRGWLVLLGLLLATACTGEPRAVSQPGSAIPVVAAENFWGSIASQLGGSHAAVQSVVSDPNADPHEYESSTEDARAFAQARLVIVNGAGYDDWAGKLLKANPSSGRRVLSAADLLGRKAGDNPHFWYSPAYVVQVADSITAEYKEIDPGDSGYFDQQRQLFAAALAPYAAKLAEMKQRFAGVPVGATESIFVYLAGYLGLDLVSPPAFMQAVSEGVDPPVAAVAAFQDQVSRKAIRVLVVNLQTTTAVTTNLRREAGRQGIPVVGISETMQPPTTTFQDWQVRQLTDLQGALGG